jgi:hypothetical protein
VSALTLNSLFPFCTYRTYTLLFDHLASFFAFFAAAARAAQDLVEVLEVVGPLVDVAVVDAAADVAALVQ